MGTRSAGEGEDRLKSRSCQPHEPVRSTSSRTSGSEAASWSGPAPPWRQTAGNLAHSPGRTQRPARGPCGVPRNVLSCGQQQEIQVSITVRYSPGQLRDAVGISQETYRHWKKVLAPLQRRTRRNSCFTAGDMLAVALVRVMTTDFSMRIGAVSDVADRLFAMCNTTSWPVLERSRLIVDLPSQRLELRTELRDRDFETPALGLPLRPVIAKLRDALLTDGGPEQPELSFPPVSLPAAGTAALKGG